MRNAFFVVAMVCSLGAAPRAAAQSATPAATAAASAPASRPHIAYLDKSKTIYIAEFEAAANATPPVEAKDGPIDSGSMASPKLNGTELHAAGGSGTASSLLANDLLHEIKKAGYKPKLLAPGEERPDDGLLISGVFTQTGKDGQLRRAAIGPGQPAGDIQLYVTSSNLLRPEKPLYEVVKQGAGAAADTPIKLNPDVATLKFVMPAHPDAKAIKKTAEQIVGELQRLTLQAESEGLAGSDDPINKYSKP
jgi:hypothetical protein